VAKPTPPSASKEQAVSDLNFFERMGLKVLKGMNPEGRPTHERIYLDSVAHGKTDPITEAYYTRQEIQKLRDTVLAQGKPQGQIDYHDMGSDTKTYNIANDDDPMAFARLSLGTANYELDPNRNIVITDKYDFPDQGLWGLAGGPKFWAAHHMGRQMLPDDQGKYRPVRINLGPWPTRR
jgi:hypothetical protein